MMANQITGRNPSFSQSFIHFKNFNCNKIRSRMKERERGEIKLITKKKLHGNQQRKKNKVLIIIILITKC